MERRFAVRWGAWRCCREPLRLIRASVELDGDDHADGQQEETEDPGEFGGARGGEGFAVHLKDEDRRAEEGAGEADEQDHGLAEQANDRGHGAFSWRRRDGGEFVKIGIARLPGRGEGIHASRGQIGEFGARA